MQSGITASSELQSAFNAFTSDATLFALPVTITSESLVPLSAIPFSPAARDFQSALSTLTPHLQPKTPIYLLVRKSQHSPADLTAITYVPSTSPVRSKTLFASTRSTLLRDLGIEKFSATVFCTDAEEVVDAKQWAERSGEGKNGVDNTALLSTEERELQSVRRAEEEERHGTQGRDLMGAGGSGGGGGGTVAREGTPRSGIRMRVSYEARQALAKLAEATQDNRSGNGSGVCVQFGIDIATETLTLLASDDAVVPADISRKIPTDRPSYTFYHFPSSTPATLFIYVCPGSSKVKERMMYASSRNGVIDIAKGEGVVVTKKLEAGDPDELADPRISDELGIGGGAADEAPSSRQGFARPKRPGRR